jgi:hypothetical protein
MRLTDRIRGRKIRPAVQIDASLCTQPPPEVPNDLAALAAAAGAAGLRDGAVTASWITHPGMAKRADTMSARPERDDPIMRTVAAASSTDHWGDYD